MKRRPALVVTSLPGEDVILCQITSQARSDQFAISVEQTDFAVGSLSQSSRIRPNRLFTADSSIIVYRAGQISTAKLEEVIERLVAILKQP